MGFIGSDTVLHVVISYLLALIDPALAVAAGIGKEIFDYFGAGVADAYDLFADAIGILLAL